ncbi:MAG: DUF2842 domain-containing protein [Xanthobacteraceae bacterium]
MPIRLRKFIGTVVLLVLVVVWALLAMALAQAPAIHDSATLSIAYYVIAGLGWVLPAMPIVSWMSRKSDDSGGTAGDGRGVRG